MAQPWTTVAWVLGPRDRTILPLVDLAQQQ
jgi:hypothetical protein